VLLLLGGVANPGLSGPLWAKVGAVVFVVACVIGGVILKARIDRRRARRDD
jgi:hypothetical protein